MDPRVHLEMGLLRLINAGRLASLEELLAEAGRANGRTGGGATVRSAAANRAGGQFPSGTASVSATGTVAGSATGFGFAGSIVSASTAVSESVRHAADSGEQTRTVSAERAPSANAPSAAAAAPAKERVEAAAPTTNNQESKRPPAVTGMSAE